MSDTENQANQQPADPSVAPPAPPQPPAPPAPDYAAGQPPAPAYAPPVAPPPAYVPPAAPQPGYAPAPAPAAPAPAAPAPAAYAQQPASGYAAQPAAPAPKKKRTWIWVVVVVGLLACCGIGVLAAVFGGLIAAGVNEGENFSAASASWGKAVKALNEAEPDVASVSASDTASAEDLRAEVERVVGAAEADLAAATTAIERNSDTEGRAAMLTAIAEAREGSKLLSAMAAESSGKTRFTELADAAITAYNSGFKHMNTAVGHANKNRYSQAAAEAKTARELFFEARAKFAEADALDETADLEKSIAYVNMQLDKAKIALEMALRGKRGQISAYNKLVPKFNAINAKIDASEQPQALTDDSWLTNRLDTMHEQFVDTMSSSATNADRAAKHYLSK